MPCCCPTKKTMSSFCCLPLALFVMGVTALTMAASGLTLWSHFKSEERDAATWIGVAVNCLYLVCGVLGLVAVFSKWTGGLGWFLLGLKISLMAFITTLIGIWITWIHAMVAKDWRPTGWDLYVMILVSSIYILFLIGAWWIFSGVKSLQMVFAVGGSGWERKNYKQIRAGTTPGIADDSDGTV